MCVRKYRSMIVFVKIRAGVRREQSPQYNNNQIQQQNRKSMPMSVYTSLKDTEK